jgi:hypothetical protein
MPVLWVLTAMPFLTIAPEGGAPAGAPIEWRSSHLTAIPFLTIAPEGGAATGVPDWCRSGLFMPVLWVLTAMPSSNNRAEGRRSYRCI